MKHARRPTSRAANTAQGMQRVPRLPPWKVDELLGAKPAPTPHEEEMARRRAEFAAENKRLAEAARQRMEQQRQDTAALTRQGADQ
jgi:hypothetical protein